MNETNGYTVGTPYPEAAVDGDLTQRIIRELAAACLYADKARGHRKAAGLLLARARDESPTRNDWYTAVGLDERSVLMLIELAIGAKPAGHAR